MSLVRMKWSAIAVVSVAAVVALASVRLGSAPVVGEWRAYGDDYAARVIRPLTKSTRTRSEPESRLAAVADPGCCQGRPRECATAASQ
jgi:hypothetical protein